MAGKSTKGSPTTNYTQESEMILGTSAISIGKAVAQLNEALNAVNGLQTKSELLQSQIKNEEEKLKNLKTQYAEEERQAKLDFETSLKEDQKRTIELILQEQELEIVDKTELLTERNKLQKLESEFDGEVKAARTQIEGTFKKQYEADKALLDSQYKAQEATTKAALEAANGQVNFYKEQVKFFEGQLTAERTARVEEAKARGNSVVNVSGPGK